MDKTINDQLFNLIETRELETLDIFTKDHPETIYAQKDGKSVPELAVDSERYEIAKLFAIKMSTNFRKFFLQDDADHQKMAQKAVTNAVIAAIPETMEDYEKFAFFNDMVENADRIPVVLPEVRRAVHQKGKESLLQAFANKYDSNVLVNYFKSAIQSR